MAKTVQFEGQTHSFPDDFTDAEIAFPAEFRGWLEERLEPTATFDSFDEEFEWGRRWQAGRPGPAATLGVGRATAALIWRVQRRWLLPRCAVLRRSA